MREYSFISKLTGLAVEDNSLGGAVTTKNLVLRDGYYVVPDSLTFPFQASTYPWPQLVRLSEYTFYCTPTTLSSVNETTKARTLLRTVATGDLWQFADMGQAWIACNGTTCVYRVLTSQGYVIGSCDLATAVGDHFGRLLFAKNNVVYVSCVGGEDIPYLLAGTSVPDRVVARNDSGALVMPWRGDVRALRALGESVIIYGADGVSVLRPREQYYVMDSLRGLPQHVGLAWRGGIAGDNNTHLFLGTDGNVWLITPDLQAKRVVKDSIIDPDSIVVQDPRDGSYWLSLENAAYHYDDAGLCGPVEQPVYSMAMLDGDLCATGKPYPDDLKIEWWSPLFDCGRPDQKRITFVGASTDDMTAIKVSLRFKHNSSSSLVRIPWIPCDSFGAGKVNACLHKGYAGVYAAADPGSRLFRVEVRYQLHDKRTIRGTRGFDGSGGGGDGADAEG